MRVVDFVRTEDSVVRRVLENARMIAATATSAVNVFVDGNAVGVNVVCSAVVSDIRKRGSFQLSGFEQSLYKLAKESN